MFRLRVSIAGGGARQVLQPALTARGIFRINGDDAMPLVRALGIVNLADVVSLFALSFVSPIAFMGTIFCRAAEWPLRSAA